MDGAKERWGREDASGGRSEQRSEGEEKGRSVGGREGGKLQGRYPEEDTGQYTVYSRERAHKTTHNAALAIATLVLRYYKLCIVMRRNVLCDRWLT